MPRCLQNLHAYGFMGHDIRSFRVPTTPIAMCPGDFLTADTVDSCREYDLISSVAWNSDLQTTRDAKLVFEGISMQEVDTDECGFIPECIPYDNYVAAVPSNFRRAYEVVDADGVAAPTTWIRGQGFSFGKNPDSNLLSNNTIVKSSDAQSIVFKAVEDSCGETVAFALVRFAE